MNKVTGIIIDPRCMFNYLSFYLYGMMEQKIAYRFKCLENFSIENYEEYRKGFAMKVIYDTGESKNIYVDTNDLNSINERIYEWSDVYAKINVSKQSTYDNSKLLIIGPSFGVRLFNPIKTFLLGLVNYHKCHWGKSKYVLPLKYYLRDYLYTVWRRCSYLDYETKCLEDKDYVFSFHTLWYSQTEINTANRYRGMFLRACQKYYPKFEGGFKYIDGVEDKCPAYSQYLVEYSDLVLHNRISMKEYLKKTRKSAIVFDTPSVALCHGWKFAEYLCMGKAIISTPHYNALPGDGKCDGKEISKIVATANDIDKAVRAFRENQQMVDEYKSRARTYYEKYLSPMAVVLRLLNSTK